MCVLAVDSLTKIERAMADTLKPWASRLRTSDSRPVSWGPAGVIRRRMAPARAAAANDRGDTMAWRAAATTSSAGASLATKAEAPASRAANSCSSPAYIVSTTMPRSLPWPRISFTRSKPVPSGSRTSVISTSGWRLPNCRRPSDTEAACPQTTKSSCRSKARARPWRIRSWSSMRSTRLGSWVMSVAFVSEGGVVGDLNAHHRASGGLVAGVAADLDRRVDAARPFPHDRDAVGVVPAAVDASAVVTDGKACRRRVGPHVHPQVLCRRVLAGIRDRLLGDPEQLGLDGGGQPCRCLAEREVHGQVGLGTDLPHVVGQRGAEAVGRGHVAAKVEDRQPEVG